MLITSASQLPSHVMTSSPVDCRHRIGARSFVCVTVNQIMNLIGLKPPITHLSHFFRNVVARVYFGVSVRVCVRANVLVWVCAQSRIVIVSTLYNPLLLTE